MKSLQTEIILNCSKETLWNTLMDFDSYPEWNPFIKSIEGKPVVGTKLKNNLHMDGSSMTFKPRVTEVTPEKRFEWLGHLFVPGLFDGRHYFEIEPLGENQVKLIHGEYFSGILSGFLMKKIGDGTRKGFVEMNQAIKARVESPSQ